MANQTDEELSKPLPRRPPRRRAASTVGGRGQRAKRRGHEQGVTVKRRGQEQKGRGQAQKRRGQEQKGRGQAQKGRGQEQQGVTVKRTLGGGRRRWDKKHYCAFCRRPQVKIARHLLTKHSDQQEVKAAAELPPGTKQRHLLLEHLRCRGNYMHNIEVIRQGTGEIVPWRQPSEDVDARNYLPCPLCLGFFLRADLWKHQASCRKKLTSDRSRDKDTTSDSYKDTTSDSYKDTTSDSYKDTTSDSYKDMTSDSAGKPACESTEDPPSDLLGDATTADQTGTSERGTERPLTSDPIVGQNLTSDPPRKRSRVQAAASRLLPISSGASESCSEVLHRMNQDHVSHQVKSDWLICKYGNKLMGNQDGSQRRYDYVSQKLRELGRFLLAAKALDSGVQNLQDLLAPGRLSLSLAAARKASGYRWSRPPLAVKTTLKTVCEIAIGESLQDGDWDAAAKTTDFYHLLGREWDHLGLLDPGPHTGGAKLKKQLVQSRSEKCKDQSGPRPEVSPQNGTGPEISMSPAESRLQTPGPDPAAPGKARRRPWSSAEKEAVWRQLGVHVLVQSVPGKEVCQRCLDLEPVLRGRHWKDIKNQVHNQIQSQKKQQFHAQMDLQENQEQQDQIQSQKKHQFHAQMDLQENQEQQDQIQSQKKQQQYQAQMDQQGKDNIHNKKKPQYPTQMDHQDHLQIHKKQLCHARLDHQDHIQIHKKQLYQMGEQPQGLQTALDQDPSVLTGTPYGPDGPHQAPGPSLLERNLAVSPYSLPHRTLGPHGDQLLSRTEWTDESLAQHYSMSRLDRNPLQDAAPAPPPHPHSGLVHF